MKAARSTSEGHVVKTSSNCSITRMTRSRGPTASTTSARGPPPRAATPTPPRPRGSPPLSGRHPFRPRGHPAGALLAGPPARLLVDAAGNAAGRWGHRLEGSVLDVGAGVEANDLADPIGIEGLEPATAVSALVGPI